MNHARVGVWAGQGQGQGLIKWMGPEAQEVFPAETQIWICKPTASNQGKGIFLIRTQEEAATLQAKTQSIEDDPLYRKTPFRVPQARVVQRCGNGQGGGHGAYECWR
jgi:hypothetical protein